MDAGFLGLDIGGTGAKAGVFDESGRIKGFGRRSFEPETNLEGHVTVPIEQIETAARTAVRQAVQQSGLEVRSMAICSQGQTFVSLDADGRPLHPAIVWYDSRGHKQGERLLQEFHRNYPGLPSPPVTPIASVTKILWLREHHPDLMRRARRYFLLPDYFAHLLSGEGATDPSTAMSSGLYIDGCTGYSREALEIAGIDQGQLAQIRKSGSPIARIHRQAASDWGLPQDTLLVCGTNDQYAGALGAGNSHTGIVSVTTGTCLALVTLVKTTPEVPAPGLFYGRFPIPDYYYLLAFGKTAGVVIGWFQKLAGGGLDVKELDALADKAPMGSGGITVIPHFDGAVSPHPDPAVRGAICNLNLHHGPAEIYRAVLESLACSLRENLEYLQKQGITVDVVRMIGGGAKSDSWLQIKADICRLPLERPAVPEAAVSGGALLAAVGRGYFSSIEEAVERFFHLDRTFEPNPKNQEAGEVVYQRYLELCRRLYPQASSGD